MGLRPTSPTRPITPDCPRNKHHSKFWGLQQKLQQLFGREGSVSYIDSDDDVVSKPDQQTLAKRRGCSNARPVGVGLPRQTTFKRQNSEKRERLCPVEPLPSERRAMSMSRPSSTGIIKLRSNSVPAASVPMRCSAPAIGNTFAINDSSRYSFDTPEITEETVDETISPPEYNEGRPPRPPSVTSSTDSYDDHNDYFEDRTQLNRELDTKWILNLSMHFRDKSDREKFFVTYAETPSRWRRVTVSCDYRNAEPGSLEMDLRELQLQRDKSLQIYEAIRESLLEIKFYDTVTNLKLETSDGRLHVHVTEDVNEIIPYPPTTSLLHILQDEEHAPMQIRESELSFEAHLSGFVYKVMYRGRPYIKKEIPGPDTVDEFLYEVNALYSLQDSPYVIDLEAIVTDDSGSVIKGLLINYAERGAVVDLLYDYKGEIAWEHRERWARHAIQGLGDIHEEGYVQGDFTLSNIVVDKDNNARIIDINRRGCPVGWEPPEIAKKIASNQRISMYIGQKSDLYQLGMTLWALAMDDDEPERHDPPLSTQEFPAEVPPWYQCIVRNCLSIKPRDRSSATDLVKYFPPEDSSPSWLSRQQHPVVRIRPEKRYIDPDAAVERDDLERFGYERTESDEARFSPQSSRENYSFTWPQSSNYDREYDSASSELERPRGRRRISDHDLMLRAQRQNGELISDDLVLRGGDDDEMAPIITISSDGTASHIIEVDNEGYDPDVQIDLDARFDEDSSPILSPHFSALHHFSDRIMFKDSETSEDTPRNSSMHFTNFDSSGLDHIPSPSQSDHMSHELAGLGTHPNFSEHSLEQIQPQLVTKPNDAEASTSPDPPPMQSDVVDNSNPITEMDEMIDFKHETTLHEEEDTKLADFEPKCANPEPVAEFVEKPRISNVGFSEASESVIADTSPQASSSKSEELENPGQEHFTEMNADSSCDDFSPSTSDVSVGSTLVTLSEIPIELKSSGYDNDKLAMSADTPMDNAQQVADDTSTAEIPILEAEDARESVPNKTDLVQPPLNSAEITKTSEQNPVARQISESSKSEAVAANLHQVAVSDPVSTQLETRLSSGESERHEKIEKVEEVGCEK